ncbi:TIGR03668 family PPOX class F420-dependent oxidoreductase [Streptomyces reniochalinae]|uniref:TIGR03668 family PPOX class F420-dependent oxidoreductase n=1 Tax=Streptomyces reniochalinae TaxID=2250578 RepID=A0A367EYS7_9ACTN|nr:TIGR03668 family PPOX class F420-dependent oxidoreductase [Streptomyces reniochalinae]RCG23298.1 TIGR03668 family PPOX class F420-dependent oxidoreductase [Streptomyces reniochalinae]
MRLGEAEARRRLSGARVLRLATAGPSGVPHLVPATFAVDGDTLVTAVDHKPKRHRDLRRLRNIEGNPAVCALVDEYDEDWTRLWWVRADGRARLVDGDEGAALTDLLVAKYPQYARRRPEGPLIALTLTRLTGWAYGEGRPPDR